jgi:hypothetical protein
VIYLDSLALQPYSDTTISVGTVCLLLALTDQVDKRFMPLGLVLPLEIRIIPASGYLEELTHEFNRVLASILFYRYVFDFWPHILPAA